VQHFHGSILIFDGKFNEKFYQVNEFVVLENIGDLRMVSSTEKIISGNI